MMREDSLPPPTRPKLVLRGIAPKRSGKKRAAILLAWASLTGGTGLVVASAGLYYHFSRGLPNIPSVEEYRPPIVTEVEDSLA